MTFRTNDLRLATRVVPVGAAGAGLFELEVPDGWQQGRGAFGGLVMSALARAVSAREPDASRVLRSMTGEIVGPVLPGPASIRVEELRAGNAVSTWHARLTQGGDVLAAATLVHGRARAGVASFGPAPAQRPAIPSWRETPLYAPPGDMPTFLANFELRANSHLPFTGEAEGRAEGWVRAAVRPPRLDAADLVALADAFWPSFFSALIERRPMATIGFALQILVDPASLDADAPLFHRASAPAGHDGYVVDQRELWTDAGLLVAVNPQTFVVIK